MRAPTSEMPTRYHAARDHADRPRMGMQALFAMTCGTSGVSPSASGTPPQLVPSPTAWRLGLLVELRASSFHPNMPSNVSLSD